MEDAVIWIGRSSNGHIASSDRSLPACGVREDGLHMPHFQDYASTRDAFLASLRQPKKRVPKSLRTYAYAIEK